ncbi:MAG: chemotaxis protein CheW, partial [Sphingomicrobium sp.]
MIEMIRDPLTHIIRNAVDHGIEKPADRLKAGKREIGLLAVSARQSGNQILIDISDDGKGIDGNRLVEKALASGTLDASEAIKMEERDRLALIFEAGLSTAQEVTAISGRGVGMDVVRSNIERIGGTVEVASTVGKGTSMTLRVPLTLTIIPALTVSIGNQHFAIPRSAIDEIVRVNGTSVTLERVGGAGIATIRGRRVPEVSLADVLGLASDIPDEQRTMVVLRPAGTDVYALAVDRIHDHEELVVKPAAPAVMATGLYAGTTLADDGSPILLFDPAGLAEVAGVRLEVQDRATRIAEAQAIVAVREDNVLLFRTLDGRRCAIRLGLVDRIEEVSATAVGKAAGRMRVQLGDHILPLAGTDGLAQDETKIRVFRLSDGECEIGYAFREVIDLIVLEQNVVSAESPGEVAGVTMLAGEPAEMIDPHWLFAAHGAAAPLVERSATCRIPGDDPWMQNMLRPIVEAAGYTVIEDSEAGDTDIVIVSAVGEKPAMLEGKLIVLRNEPEAGEGDDSIYRYDRTALLVALKSAGAGGAK